MSQDKCDSICVSDINNGSNSDINDKIDSDSDDDETKYDYGVDIERDTEGELFYYKIQKMVYSMKISDEKYSCD